ncbi:MAG: hypothetical protein U9N14_00980 [Pseudomonadota bacterium]|nr:hypothetical protein [Pseudomonadota bacterium]
MRPKFDEDDLDQIIYLETGHEVPARVWHCVREIAHAVCTERNLKYLQQYVSDKHDDAVEIAVGDIWNEQCDQYRPASQDKESWNKQIKDIIASSIVQMENKNVQWSNSVVPENAVARCKTVDKLNKLFNA